MFILLPPFLKDVFMKPGTIFAPKKGSTHHLIYGDFVGRVLKYDKETDWVEEWEVLEEGFGKAPVRKGSKPTTSGTFDFVDITNIYNSPLWQALK